MLILSHVKNKLDDRIRADMLSGVQTLTGLSAFITASMTSSMAGSRLGSRPLFHWNSRSSSIMRTGSPGQTVGWRETVRDEDGCGRYLTAASRSMMG